MPHYHHPQRLSTLQITQTLGIWSISILHHQDEQCKAVKKSKQSFSGQQFTCGSHKIIFKTKELKKKLANGDQLLN